MAPDKYIGDDGLPTPHFLKRVEGITRGFLAAKHTMDQHGHQDIGFYAITVCDYDGKVSYWGLIDTQTTPEEDIYTMIDSYLYAAMRTMGERNIKGCGIVSINSVVKRQPFAAALFQS